MFETTKLYSKFIFIQAALAVAYFNIKIPELLGIFVNALTRYARIGDLEEFDATQFLMDMKAPAANLFSMYVLQSGFTFLYILLLSQIGEQIAAKLRQDLFKQIIIQDLSFFDANRTGELVNRLTADVQDFKSCFKQCVSQGLRSIAQLIGELEINKKIIIRNAEIILIELFSCTKVVVCHYF